MKKTPNCRFDLGMLCVLLTTFALRGETIDLLKRYPTQLTLGDTKPDRARPWKFSETDIFQVSSFNLTSGDHFRVETGPADLGIGHCDDGGVWAVLIPRTGGRLISEASNQQEAIAHIWLRFHPKEIRAALSSGILYREWRD